jgi:hypothetical protein
MCRGVRRRRPVASWVGALGALLLASSASAHDPPFGNGVFAREDGLLVRTNRGLVLLSEPDSKPLLLCNEALGIHMAEVPAIVGLANRAWLVGSSQGLSRASADLCALQPIEGLAGIAVPAVVRDPHSTTRIFASTGQANYDNAVFSSSDDGLTFAAHGDRDVDRMFDRLQVSPADPMRVYASGLRLLPDATGFTAFFAASTDGAATFTEHPFTLGASEYAVELLAAHPTDRDVVYASAHANLGTGVRDRLFVSRDGARSFESVATFDKLEAFVIDASGTTLHVGARDGLWRSVDAGATFERQHSMPVHCLTRDRDRLFVCDDQDGRTGVSISLDDGRTLESLFRFVEVTARVDCAADTVAASACAAPWLDWQRELNAGFSDAGAADASHDADGGERAEDQVDEGASGCSVSPHPTAKRPLLWGFLLGAGAWWSVLGRRRRTCRASIVSKERSP